MLNGNLSQSPRNGVLTEGANVPTTVGKVPRTSDTSGRVHVTVLSGTVYFKVGNKAGGGNPTLTTLNYGDKVAATDTPNTLAFNLASTVPIWWVCSGSATADVFEGE